MSIGEEALVAAVERMTVVGWAPLQHVRVVVIGAEECFSELVEVKTEVSALVVASKPKVDLINGGEDADSSEAVTELGLGDGAAAAVVENCEGIVKVKVGLESHGDLCRL